jgi:hypothetical protein
MREIKAKAYYSHQNGTVEDMSNQDTRPGVVFQWKEQGQPVKVCLFTGLLDKNGVEIYEGDILECKEPLLWCVSFNDRGCFVAHDPLDIDEYVLLDDFDFKVVGNTHQNPELLKQEA